MKHPDAARALRRLLSLALLALLGASPAHARSGQVFVVDETGAGGAFTDLQTAVDAASDGDLVLVRDGTYDAVIVSGKALTIAADTGAQPVLIGFPALLISGVGQPSVFSGLEVRATAFTGLVIVDSCFGPVLLQDCLVEYLGPSSVGTTTGSGVLVKSSSAVTLVDSTVDSTTSLSPYDVEDGVTGFESSVFLYGCDVFAGTGYGAVAVAMPPITEFVMPGGTGPAALTVRGGFALVSGGELRGGRGGDADDAPSAPCQPAGDGGPALELSSDVTVPFVVSVGAQLLVGPGGDPAGACPPGNPGTRPVEVLAGTFDNSSRSPRNLGAPAVVRDGETLDLDYTGAPSDLVWLLYSVNGGSPAYSSTLAGALYPGSPLRYRFRGVLGASGVKSESIPISATGIDYVPLYLQALFLDTGGEFTLSNPRVAALLSSSI